MQALSRVYTLRGLEAESCCVSRSSSGTLAPTDVTHRTDRTCGTYRTYPFSLTRRALSSASLMRASMPRSVGW